MLEEGIWGYRERCRTDSIQRGSSRYSVVQVAVCNDGRVRGYLVAASMGRGCN